LSLANRACAVPGVNFLPLSLGETSLICFGDGADPRVFPVYYVFSAAHYTKPVLKLTPTVMSTGPRPWFAHYADHVRLGPRSEIVA
jgi:hypothetical protein